MIAFCLVGERGLLNEKKKKEVSSQIVVRQEDVGAVFEKNTAKNSEANTL
jgi:hypothetical protein